LLVSAAAISARVRALGEEISRDYRARAGDGPLVVLGVLRGAFMFVADLVRQIDVPMIVDFVRAGSYGDGRDSSGEVLLELGSWPDLDGRDVLVVEDVVDTGRTLQAILAAARAGNANSIRTVALLRKPGALVELDYVGFDIDRRFVVGYGLDDAGKWRHLPYVGYVEDAGG